MKQYYINDCPCCKEINLMLETIEKRVGHELNEHQIMLLAGYITTLVGKRDDILWEAMERTFGILVAWYLDFHKILCLIEKQTK